MTHKQLISEMNDVIEAIIWFITGGLIDGRDYEGAVTSLCLKFACLNEAFWRRKVRLFKFILECVNEIAEKKQLKNINKEQVVLSLFKKEFNRDAENLPLWVIDIYIGKLIKEQQRENKNG